MMVSAVRLRTEVVRLWSPEGPVLKTSQVKLGDEIFLRNIL